MPFFSIAERLADSIIYVPQSLGLAMFPQLAGSDKARVFAMTATACRQTLVVTGALAAALAAFGHWAIVLFYGAAYAPAATPLPYIAWGIVMMSLYVLLSRSFTSRGKQEVNILAAYVALFGNIGLNVLLIPRWGLEGAATATAVSYSVAAVILLAFFVRESKLPLHEVLVLKPADIVMWRGLARGYTARTRKKLARGGAASSPEPEDDA